MSDGEVTVLLPQSLAEHAGGARRITVDVPEATSLGHILDLIRTVSPGVGRSVQDETGAIRRHVNVYVGTDECRTLDGLATTVAPGAVLQVIPSISGG
jgi:molybdopterin converting factor small subunit